MKKTLLILSLVLTTSFAFAQDKAKDAKVVDYYGIDYSLAKVEGALESPAQFKSAFYSINGLVLNEYPKFNVAKYLNKESVNPTIDFVQTRNIAVNETAIITTKTEYRLTDAQIDSLVSTIDVSGSKNEVGVVFIAELYSKTLIQGFYRVVYFETATKKIIKSTKVSGKPAGFGVRNFWAASFLAALKQSSN